jgi:hypothetical protein
MSEQAMRLINRDESRHIAIDYYMIEHYASDAYTERLAARPKETARKKAQAWWAFANILFYAKPFFRDVFFLPMERVDERGRRLREAIRRFQLLGTKPGVSERPFGKFLLTVQNVYMHPIAGPLFGKFLARLGGVEPEFLARLNTEEELEKARAMSYDALAEEALAAKERD